MRDWTLGSGDPLALTLAADFRLCTPDYINDHIWELEPGGGDPPAVSLRTTYGLRARSMRIFPRFLLNGQAVCDPASFQLPPRLRRFFPNFLQFDFSPIPGIDVVAEAWVPDSHTLTGQFTITNRSADSVSLVLELCGQLVPLEGQPLAAMPLQSVNVLSGSTANLAPVIFMTGGPQPGPGPYPSLDLDLALAAGGARTLTWAQAALSTPEESFELARRTVTRSWDAERTRITMINDADTLQVRTGDPDWDAAFALSQKTALGLFFGRSPHCPRPSFVLARQPDHGYSRRGDGGDHPASWAGQPVLEAGYLASILPGAPELAAGLVRNFLAAQTEDGEVDCKPGLSGQRGRWLAMPLLATLAWEYAHRSGDLDFLREVQPGLNAFLRCWFDPKRDRDQDGFPEWDHPLQTGFEDHPAFSVWLPGGQGADISAVESPALAALLCRETESLAHIAEALGQTGERERLEMESARLRGLAEECWEADAGLYHNRDRDSHRSPAGKVLGIQNGAGLLFLHQSFRQPTRLLVKIQFTSEVPRQVEISLSGRDALQTHTEKLERTDFQWANGIAIATSRELYTNLVSLETTGLEPADRLTLQVMEG